MCSQREKTEWNTAALKKDAKALDQILAAEYTSVDFEYVFSGAISIQEVFQSMEIPTDEIDSILVE